MKLVWRFHRAAYRATGGRLGGKFLGVPVLLLTTTGRRSGEPRTQPLYYVDRGERLAVIASNAGENSSPAWWLNLKADPRATVQIARKVFPVTAREATGDERDELWQAAVAQDDSYEVYRARTSRRIPVVVLERTS